MLLTSACKHVSSLTTSAYKHVSALLTSACKQACHSLGKVYSWNFSCKITFGKPIIPTFGSLHAVAIPINSYCMK